MLLLNYKTTILYKIYDQYSKNKLLKNEKKNI